jgi:hypothetical protein
MSPYPRELDHCELDVIWHNIYRGEDSDFITFRRRTHGPIERLLVRFAQVVDSGILEQVLSVNASKYMFCITVVCRRTQEEIMELLMSVE